MQGCTSTTVKLQGGSEWGWKTAKRGGGPTCCKNITANDMKYNFIMKAGSAFKAATGTGEQGRALAILYSRYGRQGGPTQNQQQPGDWVVTVPGRAPDCVKAGESNKQTQNILGRRTQQRTLGSVLDSIWLCCFQSRHKNQNLLLCCSESVG